jgi:hypothetical protein
MWAGGRRRMPAGGFPAYDPNFNNNPRNILAQLGTAALGAAYNYGQTLYSRAKTYAGDSLRAAAPKIRQALQNTSPAVYNYFSRAARREISRGSKAAIGAVLRAARTTARRKYQTQRGGGRGMSTGYQYGGPTRGTAVINMQSGGYGRGRRLLIPSRGYGLGMMDPGIGGSDSRLMSPSFGLMPMDSTMIVQFEPIRNSVSEVIDNAVPGMREVFKTIYCARLDLPCTMHKDMLMCSTIDCIEYRWNGFSASYSQFFAGGNQGNYQYEHTAHFGIQFAVGSQAGALNDIPTIGSTVYKSRYNFSKADVHKRTFSNCVVPNETMTQREPGELGKETQTAKYATVKDGNFNDYSCSGKIVGRSLYVYLIVDHGIVTTRGDDNDFQDPLRTRVPSQFSIKIKYKQTVMPIMEAMKCGIWQESSMTQKGLYTNAVPGIFKVVCQDPRSLVYYPDDHELRNLDFYLGCIPRVQ